MLLFTYILPRPTLTHLALPTPHGFSPPRKGGGAGMRQYFVPAPRGGVGMGLVYLSPPHPTLIRTIIVNLVNPKSLIFKVKHKTLDKILFILNLLLLPLTLLPSL